MQLSPEELAVLQNREFFLTKKEVTRKCYELFGATQQKLATTLSSFSFPEGTDLTEGKISRGENYKDFPYIVLDYPKLFTKESVFAFRSMLWWGSFLSCTLHLQGAALEHFREKLIRNKYLLTEHDFLIGVNNTPWEYHYEKENYVPAKELDSKLRMLLQEKEFIKLSKYIPVDQWEAFPAFAQETLKTCLTALR